MSEDVSTKKRTTRSSIREQKGITKDQNADQKINKRGKKRGRKETGKDAASSAKYGNQNVDAEYRSVDESIRKKGKKTGNKAAKETVVRETTLGCKGRKRGGQHNDKDAAPTGILIIKQSLI